MPWLHAVVDVPADQHAAAAAFWAAAVGWSVGEAWDGHPELRSLEPPTGRAYLHLQQVDGPPGVHLDLESDDVDATIARTRVLGATFVAERDRWSTLRSPGGLPFCVVASGDHDPPEPVTWPGGHRTRPAQVCVDSPRSRHDAEVAFWRSLLGPRWAPSDAAEFAGKWHDDQGSPVQLLFQVLEEDAGPVRAHLDLASDDVPAEVERLLALGGEDVGAGRGRWHVLRDPLGEVFCVTGNSPEQTQRRDIG